MDNDLLVKFVGLNLIKFTQEFLSNFDQIIIDL